MVLQRTDPTSRLRIGIAKRAPFFGTLAWSTFIVVGLAFQLACSETDSSATSSSGAGGSSNTGGTVQTGGMGGESTGGSGAGGSSGASGASGSAGAGQAGAAGSSGQAGAAGSAGSGPFQCAEPHEVQAITQDPTTLGGVVGLTVCLRDVAEDRDVDRIDRNEESLCTLESATAYCPGDGCLHECTSNADCGAGQTCLCASGVDEPYAGTPMTMVSGWANRCVPSNCTSAADCGGYACGFSREKCTSAADGFFCHTPDDECDTDYDCNMGGTRCRYFPDQGRWACSDLWACSN